MTLRNCDVRTFLERTRGKKIVCFGAGLWSEKLTEYFPSYRIETAFSYIVDNNAALWGAKKVIGSKALEIHSPEKLYGEADGDTVVLITIANAAEVYEQLEEQPPLADTPCYCAIFIWGEETDRLNIEAAGPPSGWRMNDTPVIPKTIHYTWFGGDKIPDVYLHNIEMWQSHCPDYKIIEWNAKNYDVSKHRYMHDAFKNGRFGFAGDYARLDILLEHGGIYLDLDVELIRSLDNLLCNDAYFGFQDTGYVNLGHGFGAKKGFPFIRELRGAYDDIPALLDNGAFNLKISPFIQTEIFYKHGLRPDGSFQIVNGAAVYPARYLAGKNGTTGRLIADDETYSIHHYAWSWGTDTERAKREEMRELLDSARASEEAVNAL